MFHAVNLSTVENSNAATHFRQLTEPVVAVPASADVTCQLSAVQVSALTQVKFARMTCDRCNRDMCVSMLLTHENLTQLY